AVGVGIGLIVKWITGSILIPQLATIGASISTCIGLLIVLIICYISLKQTIRVPFV
uniref:polysaccharide biosynthesis C-terminal domain-containing protein n=2 Tax=Listeria TaxID=1637 RepID=UPI0018F26980